MKAATTTEGIRVETPRRSVVTVLAVGGTGESSVDDTGTRVVGMLSGVTDILDDRFVCRWVPYPASYGPAPSTWGISYEESIAIGVSRLGAERAAARGPVMLIGYSQGAVVIRRALAESADGAVPSAANDGAANDGAANDGKAKVVAVGLIADPHQPPGAVPGCDGWGVAGEGPPIPASIPVHWVGSPDDMICNASPDSLIRDIADLTGPLSLRAWRKWMTATLARIRSGRLQNADRTHFGARQWVRDVHRLAVAAGEVRRYLPELLPVGERGLRNSVGGRHTSYLIEPYRRAPLTDPHSTGCQTLAAWLQVRTTLASPGRPVIGLVNAN